MADCDDPRCPGWFVNEETDAIERCDTCQQFPDDMAAADHVRKLYDREFEGYPKHIRIDSRNGYIRCDRCGFAQGILVGNANDVMRYLMDFCEAHTLCHRELAVNKLRGYIHHFPRCPCSSMGKPEEECNCGLTELIKELGEEGHADR